MFVVGFQKEAGLKHWAMAGALAASTGKAHGANMLKTVSEAARKTEAVQKIEGGAKEYLKRINRFQLAGKPGTAESVGGAAAAVKSRPQHSLSVIDGNRLNYKHKNLELNLRPSGQADASYNLGKGFSAEAGTHGGDRRAGLLFKKDF